MGWAGLQREIPETHFFGAGEILLTSKDRDGTKDGYDIPVTKAIAEAADIHVIAQAASGRWSTSITRL